VRAGLLGDPSPQRRDETYGDATMTTIADHVTESVAAAHAGWAQVMAMTLRATGDLGVAEDCLDYAYAAASEQWLTQGVPDDPIAWLAQAARGYVTRDRSGRSPRSLPWPATADDLDEVRLIFLSSHPDVSPYMRAALTLRLVCGVPVADIAALFGVSPTAMTSSLRRAKTTIAESRRQVPGDGADYAHQLGDVLTVTSGLVAAAHFPPVEPQRLSVDLLAETTTLSRRLHRLFPHDPETSATVALALLVQAWGEPVAPSTGVPLAEEDRANWDRAAIDRAHDLVLEALQSGGRGRQVLRAAILSLLTRPEQWSDVDWDEILQLHEVLVCVDPSPGAALSRLFALAQVEGAQVALTELTHQERLGTIPQCRHFFATKAELLRMAGRDQEALTWQRQAERHPATPYDWDLLAQRMLPSI